MHDAPTLAETTWDRKTRTGRGLPQAGTRDPATSETTEKLLTPIDQCRALAKVPSAGVRDDRQLQILTVIFLATSERWAHNTAAYVFGAMRPVT
jgi:hypothetical protein